MAVSLRVADVRSLLRLQAELGELPVLSPQWKQHALERLLTLVPAKLAFVGEQTGFRPELKLTHRYLAGAGEINHTCRQALQDHIDLDMAKIDPLIGALRHIDKRLFTRRRCELVPDGVWYRSPVMQDQYSITEVDDNLITVHRLDGQGWVMGLGFYRARGDRPFSERDRAVVHLLHAAIGESCGRALRAAQSGGLHLSPREHETLGHLLAGRSEKQIARRMDLSPHTVHQYVKSIYHRLGVSSRAELLVQCLADAGPRHNTNGHALRFAGASQAFRPASPTLRAAKSWSWAQRHTTSLTERITGT